MARHKGDRKAAPAFEVLTTCPYDGVPLGENGLCPTANAYPVAIQCPFACQVCRQRLEWHGGCYHCHGIGLGEPGVKWFPGDKYDTHDDTGKPIGDGQHWVLVEKGPRPFSGGAVAAQAAEGGT